MSSWLWKAELLGESSLETFSMLVGSAQQSEQQGSVMILEGSLLEQLPSLPETFLKWGSSLQRYRFFSAVKFLDRVFAAAFSLSAGWNITAAAPMPTGLSSATLLEPFAS